MIDCQRIDLLQCWLHKAMQNRFRLAVTHPAGSQDESHLLTLRRGSVVEARLSNTLSPQTMRSISHNYLFIGFSPANIPALTLVDVATPSVWNSHPTCLSSAPNLLNPKAFLLQETATEKGSSMTEKRQGWKTAEGRVVDCVPHLH